jgi:arginyl-tRNA synthetase
VLRRAVEAGTTTEDATLAKGDISLLGHADELKLIQKLAEWPRLAESAALAHEPHRVAFYLFELASEFHGLQHAGKLDPTLRFLAEDNAALTKARLALIRSTAIVINAGLDILGVTPAQEM